MNVIQNTIIDGPPLALYDADRREGLARRALDALQILPQGESRSQASGRLKTLDSVERHIALWPRMIVCHFGRAR